jgi:hypothetical protein
MSEQTQTDQPQPEQPETTPFQAPETRPDEHPETEPSTADQPPEQPDQDVQMLETMKRLDGEDRRHAKRVKELLGPAFEAYAPCFICEGSGFLPKEAVEKMRGSTDQPELVQSEVYVRCPTCDGWGRVLTGSRAHGMEAAACTQCAGNGYVTSEPVPTAAPPPVTTAPQPVQVANGEPPEAASLRQRGYLVVPPLSPTAS